MSSFINDGCRFLQKLRDERRDFVVSNCLDPRHAINAVMTGYHLCEWSLLECRRPGSSTKAINLDHP